MSDRYMNEIEQKAFNCTTMRHLHARNAAIKHFSKKNAQEILDDVHNNY